MSAAATPEQAGKTRDIVKWAKQNHPDLLLMVEDGVTTENRDIVGEGVKAGVTPQSSAEIKAIANLGHTAFKSDAAMTASADVALQTVNARKIVSAYQTKYPGVSVPTEMTARIAGKTYSLVLTGPSKDILRTSAKSMNLNYFVELVNGDGRKYTAAFSVELNTVDGQFKVAGRTVSGKDDERKTTEERAIEQWLKGIDTWTTAGIPLSTTVTIAGKELDAQYVAGALAQMGQDVAAGQGGTSEATGARRLSFTALAEYAKQYPDGEFVLLINDLEAYLKDQFPAANVGALVDMDAKVGSILWGHQADGEGILGAVQQWAAATTAEANSAIAVDKAMINTERSTLSIAPAVLAQKVALQGVELSVRDWIYAIDAIAGSMAYVPLSANKKITLAAVGAYDTVREGIKIVERVARLLVAKVKDLDLSLSTRNVSAGGFNEQKQVLELVVSGDLAKFSLNIVKRQAALTGKRDEIMQWIGGLAEEFEAAVPELRGWFTNTQDSAMSGAGFINPLYMPGHKMNAIRDWLEKKAVKVDGADVHFIVVENDEEVIHVKSETVTRDSKEVIDCTIAIPPERLSHQGYSGQVALSILSAINEHFVRQIFDLRKDEKELATDLMDQEPKDSAMKAPGGIDLNAKKMGLDVTRDGKGVDIKFDPAQVAEFQKGNFTGVQGIILRIVPVASPLQLLGLETEPSPDQLARG
ncbi:MAG: hypothetical protein HGA80_09435 [Candidatus Omnitrophica bacterium]|nr:hypothetical protein [Candidatus Omnitrophota bacterium]